MYYQVGALILKKNSTLNQAKCGHILDAGATCTL